jgi:stress-induced morphogen
VFEAAYPEGYVDVSKGYRRNVHVVVVSRAFDGMTEREKHDAVWDLARERFGKDTQRISILLAYSPDELKG